jgi:spoIIIJ-associated protein
VEWVETTGRSIDEAKEAALDRLGVDEPDAEFEIVEEAKAGLFGRVRREARVRARIRPTQPRAKEDRRDRRRRGRSGERNGDRSRGGKSAGRQGSGKQASSKQGSGKQDSGKDGSSKQGSGARGAKQAASAPSGSKTAAASTSAPAEPDGSTSSAPLNGDESSGNGAAGTTASGNRRRRRGGRGRGGGSGSGSRADAAVSDVDGDTEPGEQDMTSEVSLEEQGEIVQDFLDGLVEAFDLDGELQTEQVDDEMLEVQIVGDDLGLLIGPKGQTLMAVQELARTVVQRRAEGNPRGRFRIDVGGYRQRRREALERFTRTVADEVKSSGAQKALEPMNAADRKVVHDTVNEIDGVATTSEGEDPRRRVVILPAS